jgi:hypothetical protein
MKHDDTKCSAEGGTINAGTQTSETLLRAEIGFWWELLNDCDDALPPESVERMRQALALAEHRLMQLFAEHSASRGSSVGPARTSRPAGCFLH